MKTRHRFNILLWLAIVLLFAPALASAQCSGNAYGWCADCTSPTPCCGYGPCNIFCFNCDGGCRSAPGGVNGDPTCGHLGADKIGDAIRANGGAKPAASELLAAREAFDSIDTDGNGAISKAETLAWAKGAKKDLSRKQVENGFKQADANRDGKIHPHEFDRSLATAAAGAAKS